MEEQAQKHKVFCRIKNSLAQGVWQEWKGKAKKQYLESPMARKPHAGQSKEGF
jgi:hypothetical protein